MKASRGFGIAKRIGLVALLALAPVALAAQEPAATFHVDVKLVSIFVNVTDRNGALVGGLTRDDFAVYEDGRPQQIAVFERQSELPLNITLAIDTSGSVRKDMDEEAGAARHFAHTILRPQDQMSVLQFATEVRVLQPFTNKPALIDRSLGELRGDWATALYDAICLGSEKLGGKEGRKVSGPDLRRRRYGAKLHLRAGPRSRAAQRSDDLLAHRRAHRGQRRPRPGR